MVLARTTVPSSYMVSHTTMCLLGHGLTVVIQFWEK